MKFEYDENKSQLNKEKHGIDFVEAQNLWQNENALIVPANIIDEEVRYALISQFKNKCYTAIFTLRNEIYRIISVRRCRKNEEKTMKKTTAKEFDEKFDNGEDISEYLDFSAAIRLKDVKKLNTDTKKVNVDFPEWVIESLDKEAKRIGVTRQSIIKVWIAERLKEEAENLQAS